MKTSHLDFERIEKADRRKFRLLNLTIAFAIYCAFFAGFIMANFVIDFFQENTSLWPQFPKYIRTAEYINNPTMFYSFSTVLYVLLPVAIIWFIIHQVRSIDLITSKHS